MLFFDNFRLSTYSKMCVEDLVDGNFVVST